jgi:hypothetical protein
MSSTSTGFQPIACRAFLSFKIEIFSSNELLSVRN